MIVKVLSQQMFDSAMRNRDINDLSVEKFGKTVFISIIGSGSKEKGHFRNDHSNVLNLVFDDVSDTEAAQMNGKPCVLFTENQARKIIEFLERNRDREYCFVHCAAGVSRSGAIGMFINDFYGSQDYFTFKKDNPNVQPNAYILALIKRVFYENK